jgi:endo-1,4-beta-xylanase
MAGMGLVPDVVLRAQRVPILADLSTDEHHLTLHGRQALWVKASKTSRRTRTRSQPALRRAWHLLQFPRQRFMRSGSMASKMDRLTPYPVTRRHVLGLPLVLAGVARPLDTLQGQAARRGITYGGAVAYDHLHDPAFRAAVLREMAMLVPENELKWDTLRPAPTTYDFTRADALLHFARLHGKPMRGHCLAWHKQLPPWFATVVHAGNAADMLTTHITTVVRRYAGHIHSWDVVNEQVETSEPNVDGLRVTPWLTALGAGYMDLAFRTAHAADPQAVLVYNDYGLELDIDWHTARRQRLLRLLHAFKAHGTPVHAVGIQAHLTPQGGFNPALFTRFLHQVAALGYTIIISEMDVVDKTFPADIARRDAMVADVYRRFWTTALAHPAVKIALTWGLTDQYTWLNTADFARRADGLPVRGLPLDAQYHKKPAYDALWHAFATAPTKS